jgi:hypothetical protein
MRKKILAASCPAVEIEPEKAIFATNRLFGREEYSGVDQIPASLKFVKFQTGSFLFCGSGLANGYPSVWLVRSDDVKAFACRRDTDNN